MKFNENYYTMNVLKEDFSKQKRLLKKKNKSSKKNFKRCLLENIHEAMNTKLTGVKAHDNDGTCGDEQSLCTYLVNLNSDFKNNVINEFNLKKDYSTPIDDGTLKMNCGDHFSYSEHSSSRNEVVSLKLKTPKSKNGKIILKCTPLLSSSSKISNTGGFVLAVTEGRGHARREVGLACMDPTRPHLILMQISDDHKYLNSLTKMNVLDPLEIVIPNTFTSCANLSKLYLDIRARFPTIPITSVSRRHFNEALGIDLIKLYCSANSGSLMVLLRDKFYALSAAAALLKYIEFTQHLHIIPHTLKIDYQGTDNICLIDIDTANRLELIRNFENFHSNYGASLFKVMNHCHTKGGSRLLRANILQPSCNLNKIINRLDCITELINNPILFCALEGAISCFSNIENLLYLCLNAPQQNGLRVAEFQLKNTLLLKTNLEFLPALAKSLQHSTTSYFQKVFNSLQDPRFTLILTRILETLVENAKTPKSSVAIHLHGCFAIKTGINSLLDIAKKTYCEIIQEMTDHVAYLRTKYNMALKISFSIKKGFHIQWIFTLEESKAKIKDLPEEFILIQKHKKSFTFNTRYLVALDQRSHNILNEIKLMTNVIIFELLTDIRPKLGCLFELCENIAELDVLLSFAHISSLRKYVKPHFGAELNLKESKHPILDVINEGKVVPNDVVAKKEKNFVILTGPNQSGKSIYIRQIALLQIMAQVGCYVPAKNANFKLMNRIFSRIGFDDDPESNASSLAVEMTDIQYIHHNSTPDSLVIIDELCRGTSVEEGTNLAFSISEQLLDSSAFIFFTTHYLFMTQLENMYPTVANFHFETKLEALREDKIVIRFSHILKAGVTNANSYGLQVAMLTSFPKDVCSKARQISCEIIKNRKSISLTHKTLLPDYELSLELKHQLINGGDQKLVDWERTEKVIRRFKNIYLEENKLKKVYPNLNITRFLSKNTNFVLNSQKCQFLLYYKNMKKKVYLLNNFGKHKTEILKKKKKTIFELAKKIFKKYKKIKLKKIQ